MVGINVYVMDSVLDMIFRLVGGCESQITSVSEAMFTNFNITQEQRVSVHKQLGFLTMTFLGYFQFSQWV